MALLEAIGSQKLQVEQQQKCGLCRACCMLTDALSPMAGPITTCCALRLHRGMGWTHPWAASDTDLLEPTRGGTSFCA